ncbi:hypothetical protein MMC19_002033 [Ptychographa xylographoides]|nr:hypothetical protein [Ptychographa xylographoides]
MSTFSFGPGPENNDFQNLLSNLMGGEKNSAIGLMDLTYPVREQILSYCLVHDAPLLIMTPDPYGMAAPHSDAVQSILQDMLSLRSVSQQLYHEAGLVFYRENTFKLANAKDLNYFANTLTSISRAFVRRLELDEDYTCTPHAERATEDLMANMQFTSDLLAFPNVRRLAFLIPWSVTTDHFFYKLLRVICQRARFVRTVIIMRPGLEYVMRLVEQRFHKGPMAGHEEYFAMVLKNLLRSPAKGSLFLHGYQSRFFEDIKTLFVLNQVLWLRWDLELTGQESLAQTDYLFRWDSSGAEH